MSERNSIVGEFLHETSEYLDELEGDLVRFESGTADPEAVTRMLRAAHTIKGTCGFLGFGKLEKLTHVPRRCSHASLPSRRSRSTRNAAQRAVDRSRE